MDENKSIINQLIVFLQNKEIDKLDELRDSSFWVDLTVEDLQKLELLSNDDQALFFWKWGQAWHSLGKKSGEAVDFHVAIDKYKEADKKGLNISPFWNNLGAAYAELGFLLSRKDLFFEAIDCFQNALQSEPEDYESFFNLAISYSHVFESVETPKYYDLAYEAFQRASEMFSGDVNLWLKWGQLLTFSGKIYRNIEQLQESLEKFKIADSCEPDNPWVLCRWAEALLLCGEYSERVDMLRAAQDKITKSLKILPDKTELWYIYGACLNELGCYFEDQTYFDQAIDKFQHALSLNPSDPLLWYGLALANYAIGELKNDIQMIENANRFCARVCEFGGHIFPQFWNDWGVALMKLAEMSQDKAYIELAIEKFDQAINRQIEEFDSENINPEWLYNYGCALDFLGDFTLDPACYEKAITFLSKVLQMDPTYSDARYNLALALSHLGETVADADILQKSIEHFKILLDEDFEDEVAWNDYGVAFINLAQLFHDPVTPEQSLVLYEFAESKFLQSIALGGNQAYYNLACLHSLIGNFSTSIHYLEKSYHHRSLPSMDDLMNDEWLEEVRDTPAFKNFISQVPFKQEKKI